MPLEISPTYMERTVGWASPYIFLFLLVFATAESQVDGPPRTSAPCWRSLSNSQRLPEDVVLPTFVISLWVSLDLVFFLKASLYLHYNMRVSAVIKKQRCWSCLDNTNPTGSRMERGGQKDLIVLACANFVILSWSQNAFLVVRGNVGAKARGIY